MATETTQRVRKAVIPAAGLGTRFLPATKAIPKEMIPIIDKPMIQYIVEECVAAGIDDIIIVTARGKESIADHFDHHIELEKHLQAKNNSVLLRVVESVSTLANIALVRQKNPLGLGHAVLTARSLVGNEPFAVLLGDDLIVSRTKPCIRQCIDVFEAYQQSVIGVMNVDPSAVDKYGIVGGTFLKDFAERRLMRVEQMLEKPEVGKAPSTLACPGRYVLTPQIFDILERLPPGRNGEIQLSDALNILAQESEAPREVIGGGLLALLFEGQRYDTGDKLGFIEATIAFALERDDLADGVRQLLRKYSN